MFEIIQNSCSKKSVFSQKYFVWLLKIFKIPQTCFQQIFHSFFSIPLLCTSRKLLDYKILDFKKNIKFDFKEKNFFFQTCWILSRIIFTLNKIENYFEKKPRD